MAASATPPIPTTPSPSPSLSPSASPSTAPQPPTAQGELPELPKLPTLSISPSLYTGCCLTLSTTLLNFLHREIIHSSEYGEPEDTENKYTESDQTPSQNRNSKATEERSILSIGSGTGLLECYLQREFDGDGNVGNGSRLSDHDDGGEYGEYEYYGDGEEYGDSNEDGKRGRKGMTESRGKRSKYTVEGVEVYTPITSSTITSTVTTYLPPNRTHIVKGTWEVCPRAVDADVGVCLFVYPRQKGLVEEYIEMLGMLDPGGLRGKGGLGMEGRGGEAEDGRDGVYGDEGWEDGENEVKQTDDRSGGNMGGRYGEGGNEVVTHVKGTRENGVREAGTHSTGAGVRLIVWAGPKQDWTDYNDVFQSMRGWEVEVCQSEEVGVMEFECLAMIRRQSHQSLPSS